MKLMIEVNVADDKLVNLAQFLQNLDGQMTFAAAEPAAPKAAPAPKKKAAAPAPKAEEPVTPEPEPIIEEPVAPAPEPAGPAKDIEDLRALLLQIDADKRVSIAKILTSNYKVAKLSVLPANLIEEAYAAIQQWFKDGTVLGLEV